MSVASVIPVVRRLLARVVRDGRNSQRGSISIIAAVCMLPLAIAAGVAIDMSRMANIRSALQSSVDNAALSGAAAYVVYTQTDSFNSIAITVAHSTFCNAVTALPAGFVLLPTSGSTTCSSGQGPAVSAVIGGYKVGTLGTTANSGCSATNTVVAAITCGFIITVSTSASVSSIFPFIAGGTLSVSVTASAINPFINLAKAITPSFAGAAYNANSLWIYPLLLDAKGAPDFSTNPGALPDRSTCTGNPTQTSCGSYTMLASTFYLSGCPSSNPCNDNGTIFVDGIVQNPVVGTAVITATTPLGIAMESAGGGTTHFDYDNSFIPRPADLGCTYPPKLAYQTFSQEYDANGYPLLVDSKGNWGVATHWYYSSFLANNYPPNYNEIVLQQNMQINPDTNMSYATQLIPAVPPTGKNFNPKATKALIPCPNATASWNSQRLPTNYPTTGATNCALYIVRDPTSLSPDPSYRHNNACFTPTGTPGHQYSALSCQNYAGHNYAFFWNDMGGSASGTQYGDDTDYGNGVLQIACSGPSHVLLIN